MLFRVFEAPLQALVALIPEITDPVLRAYAHILSGYLSGNTDEIRKHLPSLRTQNALPYWLGLLRLQIRVHAIEDETMRQVETRIQKDDPWAAEAYFVLGRACEILERHSEAMEWYSLARLQFVRHDCPKKALKCQMNIVAVQSRARPEATYLDAYRAIAREARRVGEYGSAGVALMNISRELQAAGAEKAALKFADRALAYMQREKGTLHHCLALIHRCHLFLELKRFASARKDFDQAKSSRHPEIQAALEQLRIKFRKGRFHRRDLATLTWSWRGRVLNDPLSRPSFAALEDALIRRLARKPDTKAALISFLWGKSLDAESADFRFKRLLQRIRKKRPGYIRYVDGIYSLAEESHIRFPRAGRRKAG